MDNNEYTNNVAGTFTNPAMLSDEEATANLRFGILSLVFSIVFSPVGIILGVKGFKRMRAQIKEFGYIPAKAKVGGYLALGGMISSILALLIELLIIIVYGVMGAVAFSIISSR